MPLANFQNFRSQTISASPPIIPFNRDYVPKICFLLLEVLAISSEKTAFAKLMEVIICLRTNNYITLTYKQRRYAS